MSTIEVEDGEVYGPATSDAPGEATYPIVKVTDRWVAILWHERDEWIRVYPSGVVARALAEPDPPEPRVRPHVRSTMVRGEVL